MVHFIRAACVLHKIFLEDHFPADGIVPNEEVNVQLENDEDEDVGTHHVRDRVVMQLPI